MRSRVEGFPRGDKDIGGLRLMLSEIPLSNFRHHVDTQYRRSRDNSTDESTDDAIRRNVLPCEIKAPDRRPRTEPALPESLRRRLDAHEAAALAFDECLVAERRRNFDAVE